MVQAHRPLESEVNESAVKTAVQGTDWVLCPGCNQLVYSKRLARNFQVCPDCGRHHRLDALERLDQLLDDDSAELFDLTVEFGDPLEFSDSKPYAERWELARRATGLPEAAVVARGLVHGNPVITVVMDFRFMGGSLGAAVGELVTIGAEAALAEGIPLLLVTASGGARMQEGALSLMQLAKTSSALGRLDEAGILTISLITDPTYGGVAASFATLTDVILAEPGARLGFAGPRVIAQTIRQTLPPGFQTAELLLEQGMIDAIHPRGGLRQALGRLLAAGTRRQGGGLWAVSDVVITDPARLPGLHAWSAVQRARHLDRPTMLDYLHRIFEDFEELHGDRVSGDCSAIVGGIARLGGMPAVVIGQQKGHTPAELAMRNYGMPLPAGYRKAARLARLAAKLRLPVITFVDTPGAYPGVEAEEQGQAIAIAELIRLMSGLPVPVLTVITGEGGSGGALALAVADRVLICSNGTYSVISPEGCASILWHDAGAAPKAAEALQVAARELLSRGIVDGVIPEPAGGAQANPAQAARFVQRALVASLRQLAGADTGELRRARHEKFRRFGADLVTVREVPR